MNGEVMTQPEIAAVVLAAGASSRMGEPKQLMPVGGRPMVRRVTEAVCAAGLGQVIVVVGAHAGAVQQAVDELPVETVVNANWIEGMSSSLRAGVLALRPEIRAVVIVLADQPALTPDLLRALAVCYQKTGSQIVAPYYGGQRGNPVLFDRALFPELLALGGDRGARELLVRREQEIERVETNDPMLLADVDTREDYQAIPANHP